jgi:hypothetical protein
MAKRKNSKTTGKGPSSPGIDLLKSIGQVSGGRTLKPGGSRDLTRVALGAQTSSKPLSFGSPSGKASRSSAKTSNAGSWTNLLGSVSSTGISDLIGGGGLLTAGLDYLSSGIAGLFGGASEKASEPLTRFTLPDAQAQTVYTGGMHVSGSANASGADTQPVQLSQSSKSAIIQTVKNALLTSSSLNDVIGEL